MIKEITITITIITIIILTIKENLAIKWILPFRWTTDKRKRKDRQIFRSYQRTKRNCGT